jgi:hypothetical protein
MASYRVSEDDIVLLLGVDAPTALVLSQKSIVRLPEERFHQILTRNIENALQFLQQMYGPVTSYSITREPVGLVIAIPTSVLPSTN